MTSVDPTSSTVSAPAATASGPVGIGGWLILPIFGFFATMLTTGHNLLDAAAQMDGLIAIIKAPSGDQLAGLRIPLLVSLGAGLVLVTTAILCLVLLFTKSAALVKAATIHYVVMVATGVADVWADGEMHKAMPDMPQDPTIYRAAVRGIVASLIWIPYFHMSKRVRNTFIDKPAAVPPATTTNSEIPR